MAGIVGDIIQVGVEALQGTVVQRNVFYYRAEDVPTAGYLTGLLTDFQSIVLASLAASQITNVVYQNVVALNIFSGDVVEDNTPTPGAGTRALSGDANPQFIAGMILLTRENNRVRHGRKYVYCPMEGDMAGQTFTAGFLTLLNNLAALLDDTLTPGGGVDEFRPFIVGRVKYTTPQGREAYRLPVSQAEMADNWSYVGQCRAINRVTTMNSRKFWRGE